MQKVLCSLIDDERHAQLTALRSPTSCSRISSCSGEFASSFLNPFFPSPASWLLPAEFNSVVKLRLGLPILSEPAPCTLCLGNAMVDELGHHSCTCMEGGDRTHLHNTLVDAVHTLSSQGLLGSRREQNPFPLQAHLRVDGMITRGVIRPIVTDQACIFPLSGSHLAAARRTPGGAATAYEWNKIARYGAAAAEADFAFVPLVVELFGSWGMSALTHLRFVATAWGRQRNLPAHRAIPQVFGELSLKLQRGLARILLKNADRG